MADPESGTTRIAVLISLSGDGGVERMVLNLAGSFAALGVDTDLVTLKTEGGHANNLPAGVRHVPLGVRHASLAPPAIARYLKRERPAAMLVAKDRAGRAALLGRMLARVPVRIVIRLGNTLSESLVGAPALKRWMRYAPIRRLYPLADGIVAVSRGVADDVIATSGIAPERVHIVRNPVITPALAERAAEAVGHPWLQRPRDVPAILGMGRLTRQKDFPTLLRAFAMLREQRPARLIILGEGKDRQALEQLAAELEVTRDVDLVGFQANPYAWLSRADLFVLSSAWEGSPNALTEALALGVPAVATDCRSGPRETLQEGRFGPLVPVGDHQALAHAMAAVLDQPLPADTLQSAVQDYHDEASARHYLRILGVTPPR